MVKRVSWDMGIGKYRFASVLGGLGMIGMVIGLGICMFGDEFQALH